MTENPSIKTYFAEVILPLPLPKCYTYRIPRDLNDEVAPGKRVVVQFGKKKIYSALVRSISELPPKGYEAKYILSVIDETPVAGSLQLRFWDWMAGYYLCPLGDVMNAALPAGLKMQSESMVILNPDGEPETVLIEEKESVILNALQTKFELSIDEIGLLLERKEVYPLIKSLYEKGLVLIKEDLVDTYKPKKATCIRLSDPYRDEKTLEKLFQSLEKKAPKQVDVLMAFVSSRPEKNEIVKSELLKNFGLSGPAMNSLIEKGVFETYSVRVDRIQPSVGGEEILRLNPEQEECLSNIKDLFIEKDVVLLHGITSSGKTHVYIKLIEDVISSGKQVLYLLPEIALTSQLVERLEKFFGDQIIVSHSKFSNNERVEIWNKIAENKVKVVLGARSALFLPFQDLGLVIIDEEHENSFKQFDPAPRYHARDSAIYLAHLWKCKTLLGSATPSLESYQNCRTGKYGLAELKNRYGGTSLPVIEVANMAEEKRTKTLTSVFTSVLLESIKEALAKKEQVILFQNRKGYVPVTECASCGWTPKCVNCDISLTYYKFQNVLKCHYCGYKQAPVSACGACGSHHILIHGYGTERIEDELGLLLPEARIARFDQDSVKTKNAYQQVIREFELRKTDILVGTQMVSKGLDFENVSLVGIINADQLLNFPDFRAFERSFQLMAQVSGRAGRRDKTGKVVIQSYQPNHKVIQQVVDNNYQDLFSSEIIERERFLYPPFSRLVKITLKHKDYNVLNHLGDSLGFILKEAFGRSILGPESPHVSKIRNMYIKNFLLKIDFNSQSLQKVKSDLVNILNRFQSDKNSKGLLIQIDVDPA